MQFLDAGEDAGTSYLVMELVSGPTLAGRIEREHGLPVDEVARIARDVAEALAFIHVAGIVHRDVKPSNILLAADGRALLADFGVARLLEGTSATQTGTVIGTARYLSPEQASGEVVTGATDIYALGLVVLEALTGRPGFEGSPAEVAAARLHREPNVPSSLPAPWPDLLGAMTVREPTRRPSAAEVVRRLDDPDATLAAAQATPMQSTAVQSTAVLPAMSAPAPPTRDRAVSRRRWLTAAIVASLLAIGIGIATAALRSPEEHEANATTSTTTTTLTTAPAAIGSSPPRTSPGDQATARGVCEALEREKRDLQTDKKRVMASVMHDKDARKQLKDQVEEQKQDIAERQRQAGC